MPDGTGTPDNETDYLSDEMTDAVIAALGERIERNNSGVFIADPAPFGEFAECYRVLKKGIRGKSVRISCAVDDVVAGCGTIRVQSRGFDVPDTESFAEAIARASNYEIYARTDGTVVFALTFYDIRKKIGE